jgi:hypothetical protein
MTSMPIQKDDVQSRFDTSEYPKDHPATAVGFKVGCNKKMNVKKTYQFKHSVKDDQIIRQKLQISILLILEMILHVIWNGASVDAK